MTSLERILAAVRFERTDRVPVIAQIFGHAASVGGVPLDRYLTDANELARCQMAALERYRSDAVFALLDANVETEALGSRLRFPTDMYPSVERYAIERPSDVAGLHVPNPSKAGRMPVVLEAARMLRRKIGGNVLVVGCTLGPMTLACQLLGAERALFAAVDETEAFERVLDFATDVAGASVKHSWRLERMSVSYSIPRPPRRSCPPRCFASCSSRGCGGCAGHSSARAAPPPGCTSPGPSSLSFLFTRTAASTSPISTTVSTRGARGRRTLGCASTEISARWRLSTRGQGISRPIARGFSTSHAVADSSSRRVARSLSKPDRNAFRRSWIRSRDLAADHGRGTSPMRGSIASHRGCPWRDPSPDARSHPTACPHGL